MSGFIIILLLTWQLPNKNSFLLWATKQLLLCFQCSFTLITKMSLVYTQDNNILRLTCHCLSDIYMFID